MGLANNIGIYPDGRFSYQLTIYIFRYGEGTVMAIMHPDNPVARKSVTRYMEAMRSVTVRVAEQRGLGTRRIAGSNDMVRAFPRCAVLRRK